MFSEYSINHHSFSKEELLLFCDKSKSSNSSDECPYSFILEWFNSSVSIQVKTSGSTGTPKEIFLSKDKMRNSAEMTAKYFDLKRGDTALLCLSPSFIAGKMMIVRALEIGMNLVLTTSEDPFSFTSDEIDFAAMVPLQVEKGIRFSSDQFSKIKKLIIGGGVLNINLQTQLQSLVTKCYATYGMTETITHVAVKPITGKPEPFKALPGVWLNQDDRECLTIRASHLFDTTIVTNDLVKFDSINSFYWRGRYDSIINSGGVKIVPEEVEKKLLELLDVPYFIYGIPDDRLGEKVGLFIESKSFSAPTMSLLRDHIDRYFSKFEKPREIHFISKFSYTHTGKLQKQESVKLMLFDKSSTS